MRRRRTSGVLTVLGALFVVVLGATAAAAQAPVKETIQVDDEPFVHEGLSAACGVEVTAIESGFITFFTFPDRPVGPLELHSFHLDLLLTAGDQQVLFKDVGIDLFRVQPDGTVILSIVGQATPLMFTGVLKINLDTGEVILEPHHTLDVCEQLTA